MLCRFHPFIKQGFSRTRFIVFCPFFCESGLIANVGLLLSLVYGIVNLILLLVS